MMKFDPIPDGNIKFHKEECLYCFWTAECAGGLWVPLVTTDVGTYNAVCLDHLPLHMESRLGAGSAGTGLAHWTAVRKKLDLTQSESGSDDQPDRKRLAIGLTGGFGPLVNEEEVEETWSLALWNGSKAEATETQDAIGWLEKLRTSTSALVEAAVRAAAGVWDGEMRLETKELSIPQIQDPAPVPMSGGWECQEPGCTLRNNLWLNLSDGSILCGRQNYDGSGGKGHALNHYLNGGRRYPLAVKLGTITPQGADVYSYSEDDMVVNPNLAVHLAHFGINMSRMVKTEKTMVEEELDLNERHNFAAISEAGLELKEAHGPGLTGLHNLGNSCYVNAVVQALALCPAIQRKFVAEAEGLWKAGGGGGGRHPVEFAPFQAAKLWTGLANGRFSPGKAGESGETEEQSLARNGIRPTLFRNLIGAGHPEFQTKQQQDAGEYLIYLLEKLGNPVGDFEFRTQERLEDLASGKVRYQYKEEKLLTLSLPADLVDNKEEVAAYRQREEAAKASGQVSSEKVVLPRASLARCLERWGANAFIEGYRSPVTGETDKGASKQLRLATMPDFLWLHLVRFSVGEDGRTPVKLSTSLEIRDVTDLTFLRGQGRKEGEEEMKEEQPAGWTKPSLDETSVISLMEMGFSRDAAENAVYSNPGNLNAAAEWLFMQPDPSAVQAHPDLKPPSKGPAPVAAPTAKLSDGPPNYVPVAIVSHSGNHAHTGHYIAHIKKDGQWYQFNDEKVAQSQNPPLGLGYLYLFKRV